MVDLVIVGVVLVLALISWYVTTWRVDGDTLQVASGLIRRNTVRLPLARVQAVDLVEPLLARVLGLAEVRVRTAGGSGGDARLQFLKLDEAHAVRASLLAMAHGLPDSTPPPPERSLFQISNGRLVGSTRSHRRLDRVVATARVAGRAPRGRASCQRRLSVSPVAPCCSTSSRSCPGW